MDKPVYLIGFMGSGKTTVGRKLAKKLDHPFIDLDETIENRYRISIPTIFSKYDEKVFRKIEHETLKSLLHLQNHVISTGGGTPCFFNNIDLINENGISGFHAQSF
jgi:shikimate kinase